MPGRHLREEDMERRTFRAWYIMVDHYNQPDDEVKEFMHNLFPDMRNRGKEEDIAEGQGSRS